MPSRRIARTKRLFEGRRAFSAVVGACGVFLGLGALARYSFLQNFDLMATRAVQREEKPALDAIMVGLTTIGEPVVVPVLGVLAATVLWKKALPRAAKLILASLLAIPANIVLKTFWDRARPDADIVNVAVQTAGTSFPSGHTMGATAFYGALAALTWIHLDPRRTRLPLTVALATLPIAIGISRVYLGAHWLSDVVAGIALGLLVLIPTVRRYLKAIPAEVEEQAEAKGTLKPTPNFGLAG